MACPASRAFQLDPADWALTIRAWPHAVNSAGRCSNLKPSGPRAKVAGLTPSVLHPGSCGLPVRRRKAVRGLSDASQTDERSIRLYQPLVEDDVDQGDPYALVVPPEAGARFRYYVYTTGDD